MIRFLSCLFIWLLLPGSGEAQDANTGLNNAKAAEAAGKFAAAEREYEEALKLHQSAEIYQRLGLVRHLQNRHADAIPAFQKAIEMDPGLWGSHLFLGMDYYRTNRFRKAIEHLKIADRLQPNHPEALLWLGATHIALKEHLPGFRYLERARLLQPENLEARRLLAQHYSAYSAALLSGVAENYFDSAPGQQVHGQALESEGNLPAALEAYQRALSLDPGRGGVNQSIGRILWKQGKLEEAVRAFRRELAIRPNDPESNYHLGVASMDAGDLPTARPHLEAAARWSPNSKEAHLALLSVYRKLGDVASAEKEERRWRGLR